jgi:hypothetical protein
MSLSAFLICVVLLTTPRKWPQSPQRITRSGSDSRSVFRLTDAILSLPHSGHLYSAMAVSFALIIGGAARGIRVFAYFLAGFALVFSSISMASGISRGVREAI